jgi:hypothetical protein
VFRESSSFQRATRMFVSIAVVIARAVHDPLHDGLSAATNARAPDAAIFFKWTLGSYGPEKP